MLETLKNLEIDVLIPIGGEDTLGYGARIHSEGFPVVCIPKTMDNDVPGTDYCLGFSTAITRCVQYINQMRSSVGSHERIGVFELFGRYSGATALFSTYLSGADVASPKCRLRWKSWPLREARPLLNPASFRMF